MTRPKVRCPWLNVKNPLYVAYHDEEWGVPVYNDQKLFEMLTLEGAQAGLSWETVLSKRDNYRKAFHQFNLSKVARMNNEELTLLQGNAGIIRNKLKIHSVPSNAKLILAIQKEHGSFSDYLWSYVNHKSVILTPKAKSEYQSRNETSDLLSKDLRKRGFKFVGSTIMYAFMQACGLVIEHSSQCYKAKGQKRMPLASS